MEHEFLLGLGYNLGVDNKDYHHWKSLLDGFILARQREREAYSRVHQHRPSWSPQMNIYTPTAPPVPTLPNPSFYRARSMSPSQTFSPTYSYHTPYGYSFPSPNHHRKRTAGDAFEGEVVPGQSTVYEQMRLPTRKAAFNRSVDVTMTNCHNGAVYTRSVAVPSDHAGGLGRSSSLSRQIARLPGDQVGRRGSMSHVYGYAGPISYGSEVDLNYANTTYRYQGYGQDAPQGYSALVAPYEHAHAPFAPPEVGFITIQLCC